MKFTTIRTAALAICAVANTVLAQEAQTLPKLNVAMDTRADYTYNEVENNGHNSGIHGRYLNLMVNGTITDGLTFSWRQRMNKFQDAGNDFFAATDWVYIDWRFHKNFSIAGGKQVLLIGGYEYDAAPIDIYFSSTFWNNIACYQFGGSATYHSNNGQHALTFQICNSPYQAMGSSCYAYNLYWAGHMGVYTTLWSINLVEYERGKYCNFIALGNKFNFGRFRLEADFMNRSVAHHKFLHDYTVIGKAEFDITRWMTVMAKGGYDDINICHHSDNSSEIWPGQGDMVGKPFYGGGLEFYPMKGSRDLRIHVLGYCMHDNDGLSTSTFNFGVKWRVNLFSKK